MYRILHLWDTSLVSAGHKNAYSNFNPHSSEIFSSRQIMYKKYCLDEDLPGPTHKKQATT